MHFRIVEFVHTFLFSVWVHLGLLRPLTVVPRLVKSYHYMNPVAPGEEKNPVASEEEDNTVEIPSHLLCAKEINDHLHRPGESVDIGGSIVNEII